VNLFLIGYVLATFDFGAIQAFVTQLFYGVILVLSLLLTLLVPVVGRHISFISPYGAFVVLGVVVLGIMLQVSTQDATLALAGAQEAAAAPAPLADLATRYFLLPQASGGAAGEWGLSGLQQALLGGALALGVLVLVVRSMVAEAAALRLGLFLYIFVGSLIVLLLLVVGHQSHAEALLGLRP
jgi:ribose transport system permease protein